MKRKELQARFRSTIEYLRAFLLATLVVSVAVFTLLIFGLIASIVLIVTWFPAWLGSRLPAGEWLKAIGSRVVDFDRMELFRDEMLEIFRREVEIDDGMDRYWMLREMDLATEQIDVKLSNGKFVLAVIGGTLSILLAEFANVRYASIVLAIFVIGISLAILLRSVIIDILAYDAELYQEASHEEIAVRMGWNRGPITGRGAVLTALGTLVVGLDEWGYRLGKSILAEYVAIRHGDQVDEKWRDERTDIE